MVDILRKLEKHTIKTKIETLTLYRLGIFDGKVYELVELNAGQYYPPHIHEKAKASLHIVFGEGNIIINGKKKKYKQGNSFKIPAGISHGFKVKTSTLLLSIQNSPIINIKTGKMDVKYL